MGNGKEQKVKELRAELGATKRLQCKMAVPAQRDASSPKRISRGIEHLYWSYFVSGGSSSAKEADEKK